MRCNIQKSKQNLAYQSILRLPKENEILKHFKDCFKKSFIGITRVKLRVSIFEKYWLISSHILVSLVSRLIFI
eukprot:snap_masked-scaffold_2-processed-gene-26.23-mRNA-1 protein AED:1.00 eAED:1.00 QI:0/0/0/0/1/1/3/0/72